LTVYFASRGREHTEETARLAIARAKEAGIKYIVVASNTGFTARHFIGKGLQVVCVTHHVGFRGPGLDEMGPDTRRELKEAGVSVLTTTHLFANVERAITQKQGGLYPGGIIADTLRMFSQGVKVAVEIAVMALDAGLIPYGEPVISVGGSGGGADTAVLLVPSHAKTFFETQVLEIICKPRNPRG
jgi:hypothetical protein